MHPYSPHAVAELLREHGIRPAKRLGQNFLWDRNVLERIVRVAGVSEDDPVLEIGPGLGSLTRVLADHARAVTAVEVDRGLRPVLDALADERPNVRVIYADALRLDWDGLLDEAFGGETGAIVANIPYAITTPLVERVLSVKRRLRRATLLVQLEVAERLAAPPNCKAYGSLSVFVQYHMQVEKGGVVARTVFVPQPDVASALVVMTPALPSSVPVQDEATFFRVVRAGFGQRRKTLANALDALEGANRTGVLAALASAGIDPMRRAETLSLREFAALADAIAAADAARG